MGSLDGFAVSAAPRQEQSSDRTINRAVADDVAVDLTGEDVTVDLDPVGVASLFLTTNDGLLGATKPQLAAKRLLDIVVSSLALTLLSPLLVAIAVAIKLTSRGPVLYKHPRVGRNGEHFNFVKFRTMRLDADEQKPKLLANNEATGPIFKMKNDPRITPLGRFLRKTSLDELPQFVHVLSGKMSLVGVRPQLPDEVARYSEVHAQRLLIKPGLTCIWQVSGRSDLDFETWMRMDLEYIASWTPTLDLKLLAKTFGAVISGRGAY